MELFNRSGTQEDAEAEVECFRKQLGPFVVAAETTRMPMLFTNVKDAANGRAERFKFTGKDVRLAPKAILALGITFNELATNAVKYGAFSNDTGSVLVTWTTQPSPKGDRLILIWREKDGPTVQERTRLGFGSQVIERGLGHELEGVARLEFPPTGVVCTIDIAALPRGHDE